MKYKAHKNSLLCKEVKHELKTTGVSHSGILLPGEVDLPKYDSHINLHELLNSEQSIVVSSGVEGIQDGDVICNHHNLHMTAQTTGRQYKDGEETLSSVECSKDGEADTVFAVLRDGKIIARPSMVIVEPIPDVQKSGEIILTSKVGNKVRYGKVVASGVDYVDEGITVIFNMERPIKLRINGKEYYRLRERNIFAEGEFISDEKLTELRNEQREINSSTNSELDRQLADIETQKEKHLGGEAILRRSASIANSFNGKKRKRLY